MPVSARLHRNVLKCTESLLHRGLHRVGSELRGKVRLVVDATGVGAAVVDLLWEERLRPKSVYITGGSSVTTPESGRYNVPKRDLVGVLQALLQGGRFRFATGLPAMLRKQLRHELQNFKVKGNLATGHDAYEAWRERDHDDIVLALALACWYAERPRCVAGATSYHV